MTPNHEYMCCESDAQRRASEYMQPSWDNLLGPLCVPLTDRFTSLLKDIHVTSWWVHIHQSMEFPLFFSPIWLFLLSPSVLCSASYKDTLLNDIRKAREKYQGEELAKELSRIKLRIDNTEVLTQDIVMNLLFSYRDIQVQHEQHYQGDISINSLFCNEKHDVIWPYLTTRTMMPWWSWCKPWKCCRLVIWRPSPWFSSTTPSLSTGTQQLDSTSSVEVNPYIVCQKGAFPAKHLSP